MLGRTLDASNDRGMPHVFQVLPAGFAAAADIGSVGRASAIVLGATAVPFSALHAAQLAKLGWTLPNGRQSGFLRKWRYRGSVGNTSCIPTKK